jgi:hypothetical protein
MKKTIGKIVTKDITMINNELIKNSIPEKLKTRITKFIYGIRSFLGHDYIIKKIGSYAMEGIFNFEKEVVVDLLAIKYMNRDFYRRYDEEIDNDNHLLDCLCCLHREIIFKKLNYLFETKEHIDVVYKRKTYQLDKDRKLVYTDSILIRVADNDGTELFSINMRVGLCSKELPIIICDEKIYKRSYALQVVSAFRVLDNLLNKKLKYLFFLLKKNHYNAWSKKDLMFAKMKIISNIQNQIAYDESTAMWLSKVYKTTLSNKLILNKILKNKNLHYQRYRYFENIHKMVLLKDMKWVFNNSFQDLDKFIQQYLEFADANHNLKAEAEDTGRLFFYYDSNIYIDSDSHASYTVKKANRLFDYIGIKKISKSVYPSDKAIENIVLFLWYFALDIYFVEDKYANYDTTLDNVK